MISNSKRFSLFRKPNNNIEIVHNCWMLSQDLWQVQKGTLANLTWSLFTITCLYPLTYPHANEFGISTLWMHSCHKYPAWSQDHFVCSLRSNWDRSVLLYLTGVMKLQSKCETLSPVKEDCVASLITTLQRSTQGHKQLRWIFTLVHWPTQWIQVLFPVSGRLISMHPNIYASPLQRGFVTAW